MEWFLLVTSIGISVMTGSPTTPTMAWLGGYTVEQECKDAAQIIEGSSTSELEMKAVCVPRPGHKH